MKIVFAGGPCTGKSTLIDELTARGYATVPEAARIVIGGITGGVALMPWTPTRRYELQRQIILKQIELESKVENSEYVFYDRSGIEALAYSKFFDLHIAPEIQNYIKNSKFDYIFLLEPVCDVKPDNIRFENEADAKVLHSTIAMTYENLGYKLVKVPPLPVKQRADFILKYLEGKNVMV